MANKVSYRSPRNMHQLSVHKINPTVETAQIYKLKPNKLEGMDVLTFNKK